MKVIESLSPEGENFFHWTPHLSLVIVSEGAKNRLTFWTKIDIDSQNSKKRKR